MQQSSSNDGLNVFGRTGMIHDMEGVSTPRRRRMRDAEGLTDRQRQVLEVIRRHLRMRNLPPSRAELASELKLAHPSGVVSHLQALEKAGFIQTFPSIERGIRLLREGMPLYEDPADLLDEEAPRGRAVVGVERNEPRRLDSIEKVAELFEARPDLLLRITDDSMDLAGYRPGTIVVIVRNLEPRHRDVVVARVEKGIVVRCYHGKAGGTVELRPESSNREHRTLTFKRGSLETEIVGVVVGKVVAARRGRARDEASAPAGN